MRYRFYTTDVFTDQIFGGNPLAVFPDARGLRTHDMQRIAQEFNLSETVFVLPAEKALHTRQLRIFTPAAEIPFAGHPTVGCAYVLAAIGDLEVLKKVVQAIGVDLTADAPWPEKLAAARRRQLALPPRLP